MNKMHKTLRHYFSMMEMMVVVAMFAVIFYVTGAVIVSTKTNMIEMSTRDTLATQGMEIMNKIKLDLTQAAIVFTPNSFDNGYYDMINWGTLDAPVNGSRIAQAGITMDTDDAAFNPLDVGNVLFYAKELSSHFLVIDNIGNVISSTGNGNTTANDPNNPTNKPASVKETPSVVIEGASANYYTPTGEELDGSYSYFNIKQFQFNSYYLSEFTDSYQMPNHPGYINFMFAQSGIYADFDEVDPLPEPHRSYVIEALQLPAAMGGPGITAFWKRSETDPMANIALYTFERSNPSDPYTAVPLAVQEIPLLSAKKLLAISGTGSEGRFSVAYNNDPLKPAHVVPKYTSAITGTMFPSGFEVMLTGNKQERRVYCRLVACIYEKNAYISQESFALAYAREISTASGVYYYIP